MAPYPAMAPAWARAEIDPDTQTARYFDQAGQVMEMAKHGTSTGTNPGTNTGDPSDGSSGGGSGRLSDPAEPRRFARPDLRRRRRAG